MVAATFLAVGPCSSRAMCRDGTVTVAGPVRQVARPLTIVLRSAGPGWASLGRTSSQSLPA